mmetsp:Transcript_19522/g.55975  ORF Transcript_19522/g.55975 Transcript_19522/m.55975 type:complete len:547 (+) Transcript_19522:104-1744(+)
MSLDGELNPSGHPYGQPQASMMPNGQPPEAVYSQQATQQAQSQMAAMQQAQAQMAPQQQQQQVGVGGGGVGGMQPQQQQQPQQMGGGPGQIPPVEVKLFVGRVPRTYDENTLKPIFEEFGPVTDCAIIRDRESHTHKGCAFIRMTSLTKADAAIRALNNTKVLDQSMGPLTVKYATGENERLGLPTDGSCQPGVDQAKLFVGSLPKTCSEDDIRNVFAPFGMVDEVFIMRDERKESRGCAFVKFAYKEQAFYAINNLNQKFTMPGHNKPIEVRFAENRKAQGGGQVMGGSPTDQYNQPQMGGGMGGGTPPGPTQKGNWTEYFTTDNRPYYYNSLTGTTQWDRPPEMDRPEPPMAGGMGAGMGGMASAGNQSHGPPGANIFIFHVPNEWTETDLQHHFNQYGRIISARIATDKATGRNRGFGFVSFDQVQCAVNAVQAMNGFQVGGGKRLKVQIKKGEEQHAAGTMPTVAPLAQTMTPAPAAMGGPPQAAMGHPGPMMGMPAQHMMAQQMAGMPAAAGGAPGGYPAPGAYNPNAYAYPYGGTQIRPQ